MNVFSKSEAQGVGLFGHGDIIRGLYFSITPVNN